MNRILLIGSTGNIGRPVSEQLAAAGASVRALVRNPETARLPPEIELMPGDLNRPDTLDSCLTGIDTVFLVWTAPPDAFTPAFERIAAKARRIVFLSAPLKTQHPFFQQPNSSRVAAERIEQAIETSGLDWTFLRPGMFALNSRHFWGPQIRAGGPVRWPYLDTPTAPIDEHDIAAVAVRTLTESGHEGGEYILTGQESLTQREQIATIGDVIGRELQIEEVSHEEARNTWLTFMPPPVVEKLLDAWRAGLGHPAFVSSTVEDLLGRPARTFRQWANDNAAIFQA